MQLDKVRAGATIEGKFMSIRNTGLLRRGSQLKRGLVPQVKKSRLGARYILRANQNIQIAELTCCHVAVQNLREYRPLQRNGLDSPAFKMLQNAKQFSGEPQGAAGVFLISAAQRSKVASGQSVRIRRERTIHLRNHAMVFGQADERLPVVIAAEKFLDPLRIQRLRAAG